MVDIKKRKAGICNILINELVAYTSYAVVINLLRNDFSPSEMIKEFGFPKSEVNKFFRENKSE